MSLQTGRSGSDKVGMYGELDTSETGSLQVEISEKCALCDDTVSAYVSP